MYQKRKSLSRNERLHKKDDFGFHFRTAKKIKYKGITLLYLKNKYSISRIAVIARKGFQSAVKRNRQKRLVKEVYRHNKPNMISGYDLIILINPAHYSYNDYLLILQFLFNKAHILR